MVNSRAKTEVRAQGIHAMRQRKGAAAFAVPMERGVDASDRGWRTFDVDSRVGQRIIPLSDTAMAWLTPYAGHGGCVVDPRNQRKRFGAGRGDRKRLGFCEW